MNATDYDARAASLLDEAASIAHAKRPAYTIGDDDVLANFKRVGERVRVTCPCGCGHTFAIGAGPSLSVYLLKHADAVISALCQPDLPQAEAILGRFADLVNYAKLGYALVTEGKDNTMAMTASVPVVSSFRRG